MNASITSDPGMMQGKLVVAGTRITVESILEKLAAGESIDEILEAPPAAHAGSCTCRSGLRCEGAEGGRDLSSP
jgi:hypothetical protein